MQTNAVLPGFYETERFENGARQDVEHGVYDSYEAEVEERASGTSLARIGHPGQFGDLVAFLNSEGRDSSLKPPFSPMADTADRTYNVGYVG